MNNKKIGVDAMFRGFDATNNPQLYCIQVDDSSWSANNDLWYKDVHAIYSEDCGYTSIAEETLSIDNITISPNPAGDFIEISTSTVMLNEVKHPVIKVYDVLGVCVLTLPCHSCESRNLGKREDIPNQVGNDSTLLRIDVSGLAAVVYFVRVGAQVLKFVKM